MNTIQVLSALALSLAIGGCASPSRMGMVKDPQTGLQFGSAIERNIFIDPSQFKNRAIKITTRNGSGDQAYQLSAFTGNLKGAFASKGYVPTEADSFGIKLDVNVLYSGQIQENMSSQFGFLGGAAGGLSGYRSDSRGSTAAGVLVGATIGGILGSFVTRDTYIVVAEVSIGIPDGTSEEGGDKKTITFGSSPKMQEEIILRNYKPFREVKRTKVAVFAGGTNTNQQEISDQVKQRLVRIVSDAI
jgi:hypothetical protein